MTFNIQDFATQNNDFARPALFEVVVNRPGTDRMRFLINKAKFDAMVLILTVAETADGFSRGFFESWTHDEPADVRVKQYGQDGSLLRTYVANGATPIYVDGPTFAWDETSKFMEFQVELVFNERTVE